MASVRIGGGQGFYGDGIEPVADVLASGVDFLVCEALAELTLAILAKDRQRDEAAGFTRDLPLYIGAALPFIVDGRTRFVTNAGGINPVGAGRAVMAAVRASGATGVKIATVVGDDLRGHADVLDLPSDTIFAAAYLGARPIVDALDGGAQIVVTGRVADAALFLACLVHTHGWEWDDWDRLAAGVAVGHLLECSGQATGGNYSGRWWDNPNPLRPGFPIAEVEADGSAIITKPSGTGGWVTFDTVRQQLLYEVHDPQAYLSPDVVADFTALTLDDLGNDRVRVSGTRGAAAPDTYKALVGRPAGWAGEARFTYSWPDAEAKARAAVGFVRGKAEAAGVAVDEWREEYFGVNAFGGQTVDLAAATEPPEVTGRLAWRASSAEEAAKVGRGSGVLGLSGPPMIAGMGRGGGAKPTQLLAVDALSVDRALVDAQVRVEIEES
ncbi:MAG TPA: acyclic terpene utilization AtuA family protein [Acidimicrobiales bacterium]|nr:acyclic terpene utilization AtuA family protein [Acidimicrobiales bacterium]